MCSVTITISQGRAVTTLLDQIPLKAKNQECGENDKALVSSPLSTGPTATCCQHVPFCAACSHVSPSDGFDICPLGLDSTWFTCPSYDSVRFMRERATHALSQVLQNLNSPCDYQSTTCPDTCPDCTTDSPETSTGPRSQALITFYSSQVKLREAPGGSGTFLQGHQSHSQLQNRTMR